MRTSNQTSANTRIQWLHKKIANMYYPNAMRLAERFNISHRQAQRDVEFLRRELGAPLGYCPTRKGYYYTEDFSFPLMLETENDLEFGDAIMGMREFGDPYAERSVMQLQMPYYATLEIRDRMTVLELRSLIIADEPHHRYRCQFQSVELFIGIIMSSGADIKIVEPRWLKEKLVEFASKVLENNNLDEPCDDD